MCSLDVEPSVLEILSHGENEKHFGLQDTAILPRLHGMNKQQKKDKAHVCGGIPSSTCHALEKEASQPIYRTCKLASRYVLPYSLQDKWSSFSKMLRSCVIGAV